MEAEDLLHDLREFELPRTSGFMIDQLEARHKGDFALHNYLYSLDLFRSLSEYLSNSPYTAQAINDHILRDAPKSSRVFAEASLLSALEYFSHTPLTRRDVESGVERLEALRSTNASSPEVEGELRLWLAEAYNALGITNKARENYDAAAKIVSDPRLNALAFFRRGELNERENRLEEAQKDFGNAAQIASSPIRVLASIRRASALRSLERFEEVLTETARTDSLLNTHELRPRTSARFFNYKSPLIEELYLVNTEHDRIIGSAPDRAIAYNAQRSEIQLVSPFYEGEVALLRGSALLELRRLDKAKTILDKGVLSVQQVVDSSGSGFLQQQRQFLINALRFEQAWALFETKEYEKAAKGFLDLAAADTLPRLLIQNNVTRTLREQGFLADPFYSEPTSLQSATVDPSFLRNTTIDTTFFFYNDFPERSRYYAGVALARAGKLEEAQRVFVALSQDKRLLYSDRANYELGLIRFQQRGFVEAEALLRPFSYERSAHGAYASLLLGEMAYRKNQYDKAITYFNNAHASLDSNDARLRAEVHLERGFSYIPLGSWRQAAADLYEFLQSNPPQQYGRTDEAIFWFGKALFRLGDLDGARAEFEKILKDYPKSSRLVDAQYNHAWTLFRSNEFEQAAKEFLRVIELDSITRFAYDALARAGDAYYGLNNFQRAVDIYNQAVDRPAFNNYRTTRALYQLGVTRMRLDSARSSVNIFSYLVKKFPTSDIVDKGYFNLALAYFAINQNTAAEEAVDKIVSSFGQSAMAPRGLLLAGTERSRKEDVRGALGYYQRILNIYPSSQEAGPALFGLQDIYISQKKYQEAFAAADSFIARFPQSYLNSMILLNKGRLQLTVKDPVNARQTFEAFLVSYPNDPETSTAEYYLGRSILAQGDTALALTTFTRVIQNYMGSEAAANSTLERARISKVRGDIAQAKLDYLSLLSLDYYSTDAAPAAMVEYSQFFSDQGNKDSAIAVLNLLAERYPIETRAVANALLRIGALQTDMNATTSAIRTYDRIITAHSNDLYGGAAHVRKGEIYLDQSNYKDALEEFTLARKNSAITEESEVRRLFGMARTQIALGKKSDAATSLRTLLRHRLPESDRGRAQSMLESVTPKKKAKPEKSTGKTPAGKSKKAPQVKSKATSKAQSKTPAKKGGKR